MDKIREKMPSQNRAPACRILDRPLVTATGALVLLGQALIWARYTMILARHLPLNYPRVFLGISRTGRNPALILHQNTLIPSAEATWADTQNLSGAKHMTNLIKSFAKSESGAVTVDWVVLTAALVGLGIAAMAVVSNGIEDLSTDISTTLTTTAPVANPFASNTFVPG
jgi:Flp pilus assembly pilin Flp